MKFNLMKTILFGLFFGMTSMISTAQHTIIEHNSDVPGGDPHILMIENDTSAIDGWTRVWFKNKADETNRWALVARPANGRKDNDNILDEPFVLAYTGTQKFGVSSDGVLRINKQYTLPNQNGEPGQILTTDGVGEATWEYNAGMNDADGDTYLELNESADDQMAFFVDNSQVLNMKSDLVQVGASMRISDLSTLEDPSLNINNTSDNLAHITFSNSGFVDNRFVIAADPSSSGPGDARMIISWANVTNPGGAIDFLTLNASTSTVEVDVDTEIQGSLKISDFYQLAPRVTLPACAAGGANNGTVVFQSTPGSKKLRVCIDGSWENLH